MKIDRVKLKIARFIFKCLLFPLEFVFHIFTPRFFLSQFANFMKFDNFILLRILFILTVSVSFSDPRLKITKL